MANIPKEKREQIEALIIKVFDKLDKSKTNSEYYKNIFAGMSDEEFTKFISRRLPFRFMQRNTVTEPTFADVKDALDVLKVPLMETVYLPYLYENKEGKSVSTQKCFVGYTHHKKVQQIITKKNKWSIDISGRDMKAGRLMNADKGAATSDREFESLATLGLSKTMEEFAGPKADSMMAKNAMYKSIDTLGMVRLEDLPYSPDDSISNNLFNAYLIGCHINSNLVNQGNYTMHTLKKGK